ncbi:serine/threonine-protein kinase [Amycolatopsis sp. NPDC059657]|uniref:serine/threonine-protein kinase n=1 Tax=Amycolatopsis sp. NPDC059657 TaxID=3346899 RepID=UPI00367082F5
MGGRLIAERYRLEERIGTGGMGVVWRATDLELRRVVALKRSHDDGDGGQIRREARIGAGLQHPNVVSVYDAVVHDDDRWLVLEYLPSRSLAEILDSDGPMAPTAAAKIGAQLAGALVAMHAKGMVHRDIKPGNILVADDGTAKLTDLGIAQWAEVTRADTGLISGTPGYLAPEVADGGDSGAPADVFSLGATLFAAVEGGSPWGTTESPFRQLRRAAAFEIEQARQAGPLAPVLDALLQRRPAARPTAAVAMRMLAEIGGTIMPEPPRRRFRMPRRALAIAASVVVLVAVASVALFGLGNSVIADTTGDQRTADPCAMFDKEKLSQFGKVTVVTDRGAINECRALVAVSTGDPRDVVEVKAVLDLPDSPPVTRPEPGELPMPDTPLAEKGECTRVIPLPDGNVFTISVKHLNGFEARLCEIANSATVSALAVLNRGQIPRRPPPSAKSLASLDACKLLSAQEVPTVVGGTVTPSPYFGSWMCEWRFAAKELTIGFDREKVTSDVDGARETTVGPYRAHVKAGTGNWEGTCFLKLEYRRFAGSDVERVEVLEFFFGEKGRPWTESCAGVEAAANLVAARLPR